MSETVQETTAAPAPRAIDEINKDYNTACAQLGDIMYKSTQLQARLASNQQQAEELVKRITMLTTEAKSVQK